MKITNEFHPKSEIKVEGKERASGRMRNWYLLQQLYSSALIFFKGTVNK